MNDLLWGILIVGVLSAILLVGALRISQALATRTSNLILILIVAMMLTNALLIHDSVKLTHLLPVSNLIVVGNFSPPLVAMFAGVGWWRIPGTTLRRSAVIGSLVLVCLFTIYRPILTKPPKMSDRWDLGVVCRQTSQASCSAAAAATLLRAYGIQSTEQEMAMLCLTSDRGTTKHGLWRGLKLKTAGKDLDVYMFENGEIDDLRGVGPVLLSVELKEGADVDPRYASTWGWIPGVPHSVVLMGFPSKGYALVADPTTGLEFWTLSDLDVLWQGVGVKLVRSKP